MNEARRVNDLQLKSRFEDIFEKFGKDFGPVGDEIDLRTGEIIINNGHLQEMENEQDVGRGLWDDFHPEDDVEPALNSGPSPNGTYSTELASQRAVEDRDGDGHLAVRQGDSGPRDAHDGQSLDSSRGSHKSDFAVSTSSHIPSCRTSEQFNRHSLGQKARSPHAGADLLNSNRPANSSSAQALEAGNNREPRPTSLTSPDIDACFTSTLHLTTPTCKQPARYRSPSPPGSGSIWAVPNKARRQNHKANTQRQSKPADPPRGRQISRESPDSDDPLSGHFNFTPTPKVSPSNQPKKSDVASCDNSDFIATPSIPCPSVPQQYRPGTTTHSDEREQEKIKDIAQPEEFHDGKLGPLTGSTVHEAGDPPDSFAAHHEVDEQQVELQPDPADFAGGIEVQINETAGFEESRYKTLATATESTPQTPRVIVEGHDISPVATSIPKTPESEELFGGHPSTPQNSSSNPKDLSPYEMKKIMELRVAQRIPWREAFNTIAKSRPSPVQLKHLHCVRQSLRANKTENTEWWTADERNKLESIQLMPDVSWGFLMSSFPHKTLEDLQREWIRMSLVKVATNKRRDERAPNDAEADNNGEAVSTPSKSAEGTSHNFLTTPSQSELIGIPESHRSISDSQSQRSESPDPLSVALEGSSSGSGLSAMQIDTPPKGVHSTGTRQSPSQDAGSPFPKRSVGTLT